MTNINEILDINELGNVLNLDNLNVMSVDIGDGHPDYVDASIEEAEVLDNGEWRDVTDDELDIINEDISLVYDEVIKQEY
jgi:hypothetical protein